MSQEVFFIIKGGRQFWQKIYPYYTGVQIATSCPSLWGICMFRIACALGGSNKFLTRSSFQVRESWLIRPLLRRFLVCMIPFQHQEAPLGILPSIKFRTLSSLKASLLELWMKQGSPKWEFWLKECWMFKVAHTSSRANPRKFLLKWTANFASLIVRPSREFLQTRSNCSSLKLICPAEDNQIICEKQVRNRGSISANFYSMNGTPIFFPHYYAC